MDTVDIKALNERIQQESSFVDMINMEMNKVIVGQKHLVEGLLIGMLSNGHILLKVFPARQKPWPSIRWQLRLMRNSVVFSLPPDLLPADVIGTMIYSQKREEFVVKQGPIFLRTSFWRMKSTVLRQKYSLLYWKRCRNVR